MFIFWGGIGEGNFVYTEKFYMLSSETFQLNFWTWKVNGSIKHDFKDPPPEIYQFVSAKEWS